MREGGIDTTELDDIFSQHGLGYREAPALYEEFIVLAREKGLSTEQLSRIAVDRRMVAKQVHIAYSLAGYQMFLEVFQSYGIETDELADLLKTNAPDYIARRIQEWHEMPKPRKDLFAHLGLTQLQCDEFPKWARKHVEGDLLHMVEEASRQHYMIERDARKRRVSVRCESTERLLADMRSSVPPRPTRRAISEEGTSPLDVFADLIVDSSPSLDVTERLEDAMEPLERIKGPIKPAQLQRLRNIFVKELGEELVAAALKDAGIEID